MRPPEDSCYGCTERRIGCHGKDEAGNWRCGRWGREQERKAAERAESLPARMTTAIGKAYASESKQRWDHKKRTGHAGTR